MSIFAQTVGENLEIFYLTLAPKDTFSKKYALEQYEKFLKDKEEVGSSLVIPIMSGDTAAYTLRRWMQQSTWKKVVGFDVNPWEIALSAKIVKPRFTKLTKRHSRDYPHVEITKLVRK